MPPIDAARKRLCERQLARLRDSEIERHEVLNVATTLMLLAAIPDADVPDDVEGHSSGLAGHDDGDYLVRVHRHLQWVRSHAQGADVDTLRRQTRSAAQELARHLEIVSAGDTRP
jgi:hypothetical protein